MTLSNSIIDIQQRRYSEVMMKQELWRCSVCEFDNVDELINCEMCQTPKKKQPKSGQIHQADKLVEKEPGIICPNKACSHYNQLTAEVCTSCKRSLFQEVNIKKHKPASHKTKLKYCFKCAFANDPSNKTCVSCDVDIITKSILKHPVAPMGGFGGGHKPNNQFYCEDCGGILKIAQPSKMNFGMANPYNAYDSMVCTKCMNIQLQEPDLCIFCDKHLTKQETEFHNDICEARSTFFKRQGNPTFDRCTKLQVQTMYYMHKKCQKFHEQNKLILMYRIKKLGNKQKDLQNLHHYIMNYAPLIIHFRAANFVHYVKDTHYRNCFQVHRATNTARVTWQDRMFDHKHHNSTFSQRVKYGTMNFTNDPKGVNVCQGYGQSYFLLKPHVRDRCTIADMDTASPTATMGTLRFIYHVLAKLSSSELSAAIEGSKGKEMLSNVIGMYKQIQIHGPVQFSKDVQRVYLCRQEFIHDSQNLTNLAKEFCQKNKLQYEFFDKKPIMHHLYGPGNGMKAQMAPQRVLGEGEKQLKLNQQQVARHAGLHGVFGLGYPIIAKTAKKKKR